MEAAPHPVHAPTAASVRFGLLVAAVLGTSAFVYLRLYFLLPGRPESTSQRVEECDPLLDLAAEQWRACLRPVLLDLLVFVAGCLVVLFGLAVLVYLAHPWWIIRRRRLKRLSPTNAPQLVEQLDQLARQMAISPPRWHPLHPLRICQPRGPLAES